MGRLYEKSEGSTMYLRKNFKVKETFCKNEGLSNIKAWVAIKYLESYT